MFKKWDINIVKLLGYCFFYVFSNHDNTQSRTKLCSNSSNADVQVQFEHLCHVTFNWTIGKIEMVRLVFLLRGG